MRAINLLKSSTLVFLILYLKSGQVSCEKVTEDGGNIRVGKVRVVKHQNHPGFKNFGDRIPTSKQANVTKEYYVIKNASLTSTEVAYKNKKIPAQDSGNSSNKKYTFPPFSTTTTVKTTTTTKYTPRTTTTTKSPRTLTSRASKELKSKPTTRLTPPNNGQYVTMSRRPSTTTLRSRTTRLLETEIPTTYTTNTESITTEKPRTTTEFKYLSLKKTSRPVKVITKTFRPVIRTEAPIEIEETVPTTTEVPTTFTTTQASLSSTEKVPSTTQKGIHYIITVIGGPSTPVKQKDTIVEAEEHEDNIEFEDSTDSPEINSTDSSFLEDLENVKPSDIKIIPSEIPFEEVALPAKNPDDNLFTVDIPPSAITDHFRPGIFQSVDNDFRSQQHRQQNHQNSRPLNQIHHNVQPNYFHNSNLGSRNAYKPTRVESQPQLIPLQTVVSYQPIITNLGNSNPTYSSLSQNHQISAPTAITKAIGTEVRSRDVSDHFRGQNLGQNLGQNVVFSSNNNHVENLNNRNNNDVRFSPEDSDRARNIIFRGRELNNVNNSPFLTSKTVLYYTQVSSNNDSGRIKSINSSPLNSVAINDEIRGSASSRGQIVQTRSQNIDIQQSGSQRSSGNGISAPVAARSYYLGTTQERLPSSSSSSLGSVFNRSSSLIQNFIPN